MAAAAGIGAVAAVFAVINLDDVEVNWLIGSWQTPLILVIVLSMLLGAGLDRLLVRRARKRKRERIRARIEAKKQRFHANDNIAAFIEPGELDELTKEVASKMAAVLESLTAIRRAGADIVITYHAKDVARWLSR